MPRRQRHSGTAYQPTDENRALVKAMTAIGIKEDDMARVLDIAPKTLRKHFRSELDTGMIRANAAVGGALFKLATSPGPGQATAAIFWAKTRLGWSETQKHELSGPNGEPLTEVRRIERVIIRSSTKTDSEKAADAKTDRKANARQAARPVHAKDRDA